MAVGNCIDVKQLQARKFGLLSLLNKLAITADNLQSWVCLMMFKEQ
jgi:hypothetical protein